MAFRSAEIHSLAAKARVGSPAGGGEGALGPATRIERQGRGLSTARCAELRRREVGSSSCMGSKINMSTSSLVCSALLAALCLACDKKTQALSKPDEPIPVGTRTDGEGSNPDTKRKTDTLEAPAVSPSGQPSSHGTGGSHAH